MLTNGDIPFFQLLAEKSGESFEEIEKSITPFMYQAECDGISEWEFLQKFTFQLGLHEDIDALLKIRHSLTEENAGVRAFISALRGKYYVTFATNNAKTEFEANNTAFHLTELFEYGVASWMVGARKTEPAIFEKILEHFCVLAGETVFIDDSEKNLVAPARLGIKTIHYTSLDECKRLLKEFGVDG